MRDTSSLIIMGVAGAGKTAVGREVAKRLEIPFLDADDVHPPANRQKMAAGLPLSDEDRGEWLLALNRELTNAHRHKQPLVLACSALKESHRVTLSQKLIPPPLWVVLHGSPEVVRRRMRQRRGHFFPPQLIESQFAALQLPRYGLRLDLRKSVEELVEHILRWLAEED